MQKFVDLKKLNEEQKKAVIYGDGPVLIVAGAGTGKTTVITERIAWLIQEEKARSEEILALTFTDKAAGEMEERVDKLLPYGYVDLWIMTFHSFCERVLHSHGLDIGIPNGFKLLNQTEQWMLVRENLEKFNLDYYRPLGNPTKFIHALLKHFSRCKDEEIGAGDYLEYAEKLKADLDAMESFGGKAGKKQETRNKKQKNPKSQISNIKKEEEIDISEIKRLEEVASAYHTYQQLLLDNESLDFGDLINYALKIFKQRPNILRRYQQKFKYILVDEFQDTNWAQYELVKLLAGERANLTVVGDDDQSIYKFRGASVSNILQFKDDYPRAEEVYLNKNYRSSQEILDLAYNFIQLNNPERLEVKLHKSTKAQKHKSTLTKRLESRIVGSGIIEHLHAATENEEVELVVNEIIKLKNFDEGRRDGRVDSFLPSYDKSPRNDNAASSRQNSSWNDFAVLVRANNQADAFVNGLRYAGVPVTLVASKGLYNQGIVQDVLAYLKLLDNYHESLALWRILNLDFFALPVEDLMEITRFANRKAYSLYEACKQINALNNVSEATKKKVNDILSLLARHTEMAKRQSVKQVIITFLEDYNYNEYLIEKEEHKQFGFAQALLRRVDQFAGSSDDPSVSNFLRAVAYELESGEQGDLPSDWDEGPESVKVMTIHAAKGLEFKYVFIVNMVDKRFPSLERRDPIELPDELVKEIIPGGDVHLQEERRLFYVGVTRAKRGLYFSSADNYGGKTKKRLSRFLYESGVVNSESRISNAEKISNIQYPISKSKNFPSFGDKAVAVKDSKKNIILPKSFSFSQLKAFETCPYQYYLQFILKVPSRGKAVFSYGKTMHATLERFMERLKILGGVEQGELFSKNKKQEIGNQKLELPDLNELLAIYKESWIDDWYDSKQQKEDYKKQGEKSLREFYNQIKEDTPAVMELEKGFNFKIKGYTVRGVIDRVDRVANNANNNLESRISASIDEKPKVELIDYKTGRAKIEKTVDQDQLLLYQIAAAEVFGWEVANLTYYYLDNNTAVSFLGTEKDIEKIKAKMVELIEGILSYDFTAAPSQHNCQYCDFREICNYRE